MAIIQRGSLDTFSAKIPASASGGRKALDSIRTISVLSEATRDIQSMGLEFDSSTEPRGLALKSLMLTEGFEGLLQKLFSKTNEVYFLAWSWDLSGTPIVEYPGASATTQSCMIPLRVGQVREFMGAGVALFPARKVTAGLATRIMIWESDEGVRDFGKAMSEVANTLKASKLNNLLSLLSSGVNVTMATVNLVKDAAIELASAVGIVLQANSDDYVDFYEGYYPVSEKWTAGEEKHLGHASEIVLSRFV